MGRDSKVDIHHIREVDVDLPEVQIPHNIKDEVGFTEGKDKDGSPKQINVKNVDCYAKIKFIPEERGGPMLQHYVKVGLSGLVFDPWGIFAEGTQAKDAKHLGRPAWVFRRVNKGCFENYLRFLMTRNKAYFTQAEREIRSNG